MTSEMNPRTQEMPHSFDLKRKKRIREMGILLLELSGKRGKGEVAL